MEEVVGGWTKRWGRSAASLLAASRMRFGESLGVSIQAASRMRFEESVLESSKAKKALGSCSLC